MKNLILNFSEGSNPYKLKIFALVAGVFDNFYIKNIFLNHTTRNKIS